MKKYLLFLISIFSVFLICENVYALNIIDVGNFLRKYGDPSKVIKSLWDDATNTFLPSTSYNVPPYDDSISIFDKFGYDLELYDTCYRDIYYAWNSDTNYVLSNFNDGLGTYSNVVKLCSQGSSLSVDKIKEYLPYHIHFSYSDKGSSNKYDIYVFSPHELVLYNGELKAISDNRYRDYYIIVTIPRLENCYFNVNGTNRSCNLTAYNDNNYFGFNNHDSWYGFSDNYFGKALYTGYQPKITIYNDYNSISSYADLEITSNYDIKDSSDNSIITGATKGFIFNTDSEIIVPYQYYAYFIPKKNSGFNTYIWTDSNFHYDEFYNNDNGGKIFLETGGFDVISYAALNEYSWFRWDYYFSDNDINAHKSIRIGNHFSEKNLTIKYKSTDFYVYLMDSNDNAISVNGVTYENDYNDWWSRASQHNVKNVYTFDYEEDTTDFLKDIPGMLRNFGSSFAFLGLMITTFFTFIATEIGSYLIILFGFMIIMLIVDIMR